jgi:hypothetical protein
VTILPGTRTRRTRVLLWITVALIVALAIWVWWMAAHTAPAQPV